MKKLACISILCTIAFSVHAEGNMYMGFGLGSATQQRETSHNRNIEGYVNGAPVSVSVNEDDRKFGGKLYIGHQFNENFALEAGYNYLNKSTLEADAKNRVDQSPAAKEKFDVQGHIFSLTANGVLPLNDSFSLVGKVGGAIYYSKANLSVDVAPGNGGGHVKHSHTKSTGVPVFGIGAEYKIDKDVAMRVEYENFGKPNVSLEGGDRKMKRVDMISIGLRSSFN